MNALYAAWDAYQAQPTSESLDAFLRAAAAFQSGGGTLPEDMAKLVRLAGGPQGLPEVTVNERQPVPAWAWVAGLGALAWIVLQEEI